MENQIFELQYAIDTFYFLVCGALVMWMAAGFSMLEAGMVRSKNTAEILTKNVALFAISCVMYMIYGYSLMYGGEIFLTGIAGGETLVADALTASAENGFGGDSVYSSASDFFFQVVFVATAMSIVSGAVAERMKLWAFLMFAVVMTGVIYPLEGRAGGAAALAGVLLLGARKGKYRADGSINPIPGANMPLATLGTFILWMGWFGFNGGSVLKLGDIASANSVAMVFLNTNAAAAGGVIGAMVLARILFGKTDLTMVLNGALAGLVAITAEPSTPSALQATLIGAAGGVLVVFSILGLDRLRIDDPVGAISVHGVVGLLGVLVVPITNPDTTFVGQLVGAGTIFGWVFVASLVTWGIIKVVIGLRVSEEEEYAGVDLSECGLEAYPEFVGSQGSGK